MAEYPIIENTKFEADDEYIPVPVVEPGPPTWMDGSLRIGLAHVDFGELPERAGVGEKTGGERAADFFG